MLMSWLKHSFCLLGCVFIFSCQPDEKGKSTPDATEVQKKMIGVNREMVKKESSDIENYISRQGLEMTETGTGLRYMIVRTSNGKQAQPGMIAHINYRISLLDGTETYSNKGKSPVSFKIAEDHVESGLHEGVSYMKEGEKAVLIMPSHLAHGLVGDEKKIPGLTPIVYELELVKLE